MDNGNIKNRIPAEKQVIIIGLLCLFVIMCKPLFTDYLLGDAPCMEANLQAVSGGSMAEYLHSGLGVAGLLHGLGLGIELSLKINIAIYCLLILGMSYLLVTMTGLRGISNICLTSLLSVNILVCKYMYSQANYRIIMVYALCLCVLALVMVILGITGVARKLRSFLVDKYKQMPKGVWIFLTALVVIIAIYQTDWILLNNVNILKL